MLECCFWGDVVPHFPEPVAIDQHWRKPTRNSSWCRAHKHLCVSVGRNHSNGVIWMTQRRNSECKYFWDFVNLDHHQWKNYGTICHVCTCTVLGQVVGCAPSTEANVQHGGTCGQWKMTVLSNFTIEECTLLTIKRADWKYGITKCVVPNMVSICGWCLVLLLSFLVATYQQSKSLQGDLWDNIETSYSESVWLIIRYPLAI